jgi:hypothetical protein
LNTPKSKNPQDKRLWVFEYDDPLSGSASLGQVFYGLADGRDLLGILVGDGAAEFSKAMINSTRSSESAFRSSRKRAAGTIAAGSAFSLSMMIALTFSKTACSSM